MPSIIWISDNTLVATVARSGPSMRQSTSQSPITTTERRAVAELVSRFRTATIWPGRTRR
jgi:hypothetical protein